MLNYTKGLILHDLILNFTEKQGQKGTDKQSAFGGKGDWTLIGYNDRTKKIPARISYGMKQFVFSLSVMIEENLAG